MIPGSNSVEIGGGWLTPPSSRGTRFYRPELDTLRFFAFLGVFTLHVFPHDPIFYSKYHFVPKVLIPAACAVSAAGAFGVDLFFALSAYLITVLLFREEDQRGSVDVKAFYVRRILRIWPLYFFFLAIAIVLPLVDRYQRLEWPDIVGYLTLAGNWVYIWKGVPASIAVPLWSISVEEQFYLIWPLLFRFIPRVRMIYLVLALLCVGNLSRIWLLHKHAIGRAAEYNTFVRIDAIAFGILLAVVLGDRQFKLSLLSRCMLLGLCLSGWLMIGSYAGLNAPHAPLPVIGTLLGRPGVAICAVGFLIAVIGAPGSGATILSHPVLVYLGRISYGLYVYHMLGLMFARHIFRTDTSNGYLGYATAGLLLTVLFSAASYRWLESPFLRIKDRFSVVPTRPVEMAWRS